MKSFLSLLACYLTFLKADLSHHVPVTLPLKLPIIRTKILSYETCSTVPWIPVFLLTTVSPALMRSNMLMLSFLRLLFPYSFDALRGLLLIARARDQHRAARFDGAGAIHSHTPSPTPFVFSPLWLASIGAFEQWPDQKVQARRGSFLSSVLLLWIPLRFYAWGGNKS